MKILKLKNSEVYFKVDEVFVLNTILEEVLVEFPHFNVDRKKELTLECLTEHIKDCLEDYDGYDVDMLKGLKRKINIITSEQVEQVYQALDSGKMFFCLFDYVDVDKSMQELSWKNLELLKRNKEQEKLIQEQKSILKLYENEAKKILKNYDKFSEVVFKSI